MATAEEQEQVDELRDLLGEPSAADSLFTDAKLLLWIQGTSSMEHAALKGWRAKMGRLSDLVNTTDGAAGREMAQAFEHAQEMVKMYSGLAKSPNYGRSRVGRITRS